MTAVEAPRAPLLVMSPRLGAVSETFIERHCRDLCPGGTALATFDARALPKPIDGRVLIVEETAKPQPTISERLRWRLRRAELRRAARPVWWVDPSATRAIVEHAIAQGARSALLEYLDRWLNVIPLLRSAGMRVVVHGHGYDLSASLLNPPTLAAYRAHLPQAEAVVVPSEHARGRLRAAGIEANVEVIPYGIDVPASRPDPPPPRPGLRCIAVGRLVAKKDPVGLIRALGSARRLGADAALDLIGDGPLWEQSNEALSRLGLVDAVRLHGALPNDAVRERMLAADVFVQRSVRAEGGDEEGLPLAVLEAMASGLPVVATRHAGIPEAVVDGATGLLVDEDDVHGFARAIARYAADGALRRRHGEAAWERARDRFGWGLNRERLLHVLGLPDG